MNLALEKASHRSQRQSKIRGQVEEVTGMVANAPTTNGLG